MHEERFSAWVLWKGRRALAHLARPGVYALAVTDEGLSGRSFSWRADIVYIGMTNAASGLKGRLQQFDNTIAGKQGHGGADRVRYKHRDYPVLCDRLWVAVAPFKCDVRSQKPEDLLAMGRVASFEYECFAAFAGQFGRLPEFNDKKQARKYSLTVARGHEK